MSAARRGPIAYDMLMCLNLSLKPGLIQSLRRAGVLRKDFRFHQYHGRRSGSRLPPSALLFVHHGGVAVLAAPGLGFRRHVIGITITSFEFTSARLQLTGGHLTSLVVYRTCPITPLFFREFDNLLSCVSALKEVLIVADFIIRHDRPNESHEITFTRLLTLHGFAIHVHHFTSKIEKVRNASSNLGFSPRVSPNPETRVFHRFYGPETRVLQIHIEVRTLPETSSFEPKLKTRIIGDYFTKT